MESKWRNNLFELGLLNWGFTLAARLLDFPGPPARYLVNRQGPLFHQPIFVSLVSDHWGEFFVSSIPVAGPFPYGYHVEPDH